MASGQRTHPPSYRAGFVAGYEKGLAEGRRKVLPAILTHSRGKYNDLKNFDLSSMSVTAFISAKNEEKTIGKVVKSLTKAGVPKIVVVANGCTDKTASVAEYAGATVINHPEPLGYDVGRGVGLLAHTDDINLVLDADFVITAKDIAPFVVAVNAGVDVALNDLNPLYVEYAPLDAVSLVKYHLNVALGKPELGVNSLTAVPHALSRRAVETIGLEPLCVPPKALAKAVLSRLTVEAVYTVDVFKPNQIRPDVHNRGGKDLVAEMIVGDHCEALHYYLEQTDKRGGRTDMRRKMGPNRWTKTNLIKGLIKDLTSDTT